MLLLVGLGNPGSKYAKNRHNAGFMAVDAIADAHGFSSESKKFQGLFRTGMVDGVKVGALKPTTFYNEAGNAVRAAAQFHKIEPDQIIVFHDEIDLAPGKLRVKKGGGAAGNNGLKSITAHMGPDFWRVRIGVGHPGRKEAVMPHVLSDFSKAEREEWFDEMCAGMGRALPLLLPLDEAATGRFMSAVVQPPSSKKDVAAPQTEQPRKPATQKQQPATSQEETGPDNPFVAALKALKKAKD